MRPRRATRQTAKPPRRQGARPGPPRACGRGPAVSSQSALRAPHPNPESPADLRTQSLGAANAGQQSARCFAGFAVDDCRRHSHGGDRATASTGRGGSAAAYGSLGRHWRRGTARGSGNRGTEMSGRGSSAEPSVFEGNANRAEPRRVCCSAALTSHLCLGPPPGPPRGPPLGGAVCDLCLLASLSVFPARCAPPPPPRAAVLLPKRAPF